MKNRRGKLTMKIVDDVDGKLSSFSEEFDDGPSWRRFHLVDFPTVTLRRLIAKDRKLFRLN